MSEKKTAKQDDIDWELDEEERVSIAKVSCVFLNGGYNIYQPTVLGVTGENNAVQVLLDKGEIFKVLCGYHKEGICNSPCNNTRQSKCYLMDAKVD